MKKLNKKRFINLMGLLFVAFALIFTNVFAYHEEGEGEGTSGPVSALSKLKSTEACKDSRAINFSNRGQHNQSLCVYVQGEKNGGACPMNEITQNLQKGNPDWGYSSRVEETAMQIIVLQKYLKDNGFNPGPIDGMFGPLTEGAVKRAQKYFGIIATGIVDDEMRVLMNRCGK